MPNPTLQLVFRLIPCSAKLGTNHLQGITISLLANTPYGPALPVDDEAPEVSQHHSPLGTKRN